MFLNILQDEGHLPSIIDGETNIFFEKTFSSSVIWIGGRRSVTDFSWTDKSSWSYTNWQAGEPSTTYECIAADYSQDQSWKTYNCSLENFFVCQQPSSESK